MAYFTPSITSYLIKFNYNILYYLLGMEQGKNVDVLFLGTLDSGSDSTRNDLNEKSAHYDEISFNDPVSVELLRIPHGDK